MEAGAPAPPPLPRRTRRLTRAHLLVFIVLALVALRTCWPGPPLPGQAEAVQRAATTRSAESAPSREPGEARASVAPVMATTPETTSNFRMRALTFTIDAQGVQLGDAVTVAGRVKAPPLTHESRRIEFEAYDAAGQAIYAGSMPHPLWQRGERGDADGKLVGGESRVAKGAFHVRIPAELAAARIAFFEVQPDIQGRREIGNFALP